MIGLLIAGWIVLCVADCTGFPQSVREHGLIRGAQEAAISLVWFVFFGPYWFIGWAFVVTQIGVALGL